MRRALTIPNAGQVATLSKFSATVRLVMVFAEGNNPALLEVLNGAGQLKCAISTGSANFSSGVAFFEGASVQHVTEVGSLTGTIDPVTGVVNISSASGPDTIDYLSVALPPDLLIETTDTVRLTLDAFSQPHAIFVIEDFQQKV